MPTVTHSYYRKNRESNFEYEKTHEYKEDYVRHDNVTYCPNCGTKDSVWVSNIYDEGQTCICMNCNIVISIEADYAYTLDVNGTIENNTVLQTYNQLKEYEQSAK